MGKKRAVSRGSGSPTQHVALEEFGSSEAAKLREEANKLFGRKEYMKALESYDRALKATNEESSTEEKALLHSNKAACYMMQQKFKEAVNECSQALDTQPSYHRALVRRAKAYEQMGHFKQALSDIQKANKADTANPDTQETEKRLKDIVTGKKAAVLANANGVSKKSQLGRTNNRLVFTAKCDLEGETRLVHLMGQLNYAEVLDAVKDKFPNAGPFLLKYLDREGDLVTIADKADVHKAVGELLEQADRKQGNQHGPRLHSQSPLPPLHLKLIPVASQDDVPKPPLEEQLALEQLAAARRVFQAQALKESRKANEAQQLEAGNAQQQDAVQETTSVDQWIVDFAGLFREQLGIEPDRHLDLTSQAWDSLQAAMDSTVADDRAPALFEQAWNKFQEVSASGQIQMGNVALALGKRLIDKAVAAGDAVSGVAEDSEKQFKRAEERYIEANRLKPDMYDATVSMANLEFERGKLAMELSIVNPTPLTEEEKQDPKAEEKAQAAQMAAVEAGLSKITEEGLKAAEPHFEATWSKLQQALDMLPPEQHGIKLKPPAPEGQQPQQQGQVVVEEEPNPWAHCMVVWGNLLYEHSQFRSAVGGDWKGPLKHAYDNFRAAGCPSNEIRTAMGAHARSKEIDFLEEEEKQQPQESEEAGAVPQENGQAKVEAPTDAETESPSGADESAAPTGNHTQGDALTEASKEAGGDKKNTPKGLPSLSRPKKKASATEKSADKADESSS